VLRYLYIVGMEIFARVNILDGKAVRDVNREVIAEMIKAVDVPVQVGGGVRSRAEVEKILGMGAWRVAIGTLAIIDQVAFWELNRLHPHRIVVSLDVKPDNEIVIRGWTEETGEYLEETMIALSRSISKRR
jgi:phosphoribosylformimino-5-aminoimidazole carboxamide ribotide isomerase